LMIRTLSAAQRASLRRIVENSGSSAYASSCFGRDAVLVGWVGTVAAKGPGVSVLSAIPRFLANETKARSQ